MDRHNYHRFEKTTTQANPPRGTQLMAVAGPYQGQTYPLKRVYTPIGRAEQCDIWLNNPLVAEQHAVIAFNGDDLILYDQTNLSGSWINGQRVTKHILQPDDLLQIGDTVLTLTTEAPADIPPLQFHQMAVTPPPLPDYEYLAETDRTPTTQVYQARHQSGQLVTVKLFPALQADMQDKFSQQLEVAIGLRHKHVAQIYEGGIAEQTPYVVMAYNAGGRLSDRLQPGRGLSKSLAIQTIGQLCEALEYANRRGVHHQALTPDRILFDDYENILLDDCGLARLVLPFQMTPRGPLAGDPRYYAYEQACGKPIDARSNIYQLGLLLYQILTGYLPFEADDPFDVLHKQINLEPIPPTYHNPSLSLYFDDVIRTALVKEAQGRFNTYHDFMRAVGYTQDRRARQGSRFATFHLKLVGESPTTKTLHLRRGNWLFVGRDDINPDDHEISRRHAQFRYQAGHWWLEDEGSTNGTYLNEQRVFEPILIKPNDHIRFGKTMMTVTYGQPED